jgi:polar amino acid transport system substrate-binding protein
MRLTHFLGGGLLALCLAIGAGSPRADEPLRLVTLEWPPYEFETDGKVQGVAVDIVREAFSRLDTPIQIQLNPWARSLEMVRRGDADAIFTAYRTDKRETFLTYCDEVLAMQRVGLFKRSGDDIDFDGDMTALSDKRVAVVRDVSYGEKFDRMVERDGFEKVRVVNGAHSAVRLLVRGDVDLIPGNVAAVRTALAETGLKDDAQLVRPVLSQVPSYIAFSKEAGEGDRCSDVNATLRSMRQDGTIDEIYDAYNAR